MIQAIISVVKLITYLENLKIDCSTWNLKINKGLL